MSEMEAWNYCKQCNKDTIHMFSGSGTKGICMKCNTELPREQRADLKRVVSYNG